jgi:hypothetical protein
MQLRMIDDDDVNASEIETDYGPQLEQEYLKWIDGNSSQRSLGFATLSIGNGYVVGYLKSISLTLDENGGRSQWSFGNEKPEPFKDGYDKRLMHHKLKGMKWSINTNYKPTTGRF